MTLEELYNKVMSDRDIMAEFVKASGTGALSDFAKQYDCDATDDEIRKCFMNKCGDEGELDDDALEDVSGGMLDFGAWINKLFTSLFGESDAIGISTGNTAAPSKNSVLGGGIVDLNGPVTPDKILGKGTAPAKSNNKLSMGSIYKKM